MGKLTALLLLVGLSAALAIPTVDTYSHSSCRPPKRTAGLLCACVLQG